LAHFHDSVNVILCFIISSIARVVVPFSVFVHKCFPLLTFTDEIFTIVFQGNYATPFIILFIAITFIKSFFYIFGSREKKSEKLELPPYNP